MSWSKSAHYTYISQWAHTLIKKLKEKIGLRSTMLTLIEDTKLQRLFTVPAMSLPRQYTHAEKSHCPHINRPGSFSPVQWAALLLSHHLSRQNLRSLRKHINTLCQWAIFLTLGLFSAACPEHPATLHDPCRQCN